ncbi:MAG: hypothetical protein A2Y13_02825 [Planctomycetes bacterium GWC2_45_44]|nr:MAG: hypothetical protein A2Y13_02825 [Planctomycetes bacterium GWC2_45_44]HBR19406.1 hypothetical protein [Phycisphaerales bacterium]
MAVDVVKQPLPCTQAEYEHFKTIYREFCYVADHKNEQSNSKYSYKQTAVLAYLKSSWPVIEAICQVLNIELELTPDDARHAITGLGLKGAAALCTSGRNSSMQAKKVIAFEEERLLDLARALFDNIMVRLHLTFRTFPQSAITPNTTPLRADWQKVPIIEVPKIQESKAKPPVETLTKIDSNILQAMSENPEANMLRVEIEGAAGYGKDAVTNSLKRLEAMGFVCRPYSAKRKGWTLTGKGAATTKNLRH